MVGFQRSLMKTIEEICRQLSAGQFEFSRHAFRRSVERNISDSEIREAGASAESSKTTRTINTPQVVCC